MTKFLIQLRSFTDARVPRIAPIKTRSFIAMARRDRLPGESDKRPREREPARILINGELYYVR